MDTRSQFPPSGEWIVPQAYHGDRIDYMLAVVFPSQSRSRWSSWIKMGAILLNGQPCQPKDKVSAGHRIQCRLQEKDFRQTPEHHQAQDIALAVVYEDDDVLILNKPAGLIVHPGAGQKDNTLLNALLHHHPSAKDLVRAGIIHRLDKDTTGLLVVAKTATAQKYLIEAMQERRIQREYLCLVHGHIISGGRIETGFGRNPGNRLKMAALPVGSGKPALTHYQPKCQFTDYTLLKVKLETGRTHQIRVHMQHMKHPIVGDPLYGGRTKIPKGANDHLVQLLHDFKRQALHAHSLCFSHPLSGQPLAFTAEIPHDFQSLIDGIAAFYANN